MAVIPSAIPSQAYELIRNRIGEILIDELAAQATLQGDPKIAATVYIERFVAFDFSELPAVNVSLNTGNYAQQTVRSVDGTYRFNVDCHTSAKSTITVRGDSLAMTRLQRLMATCQGILEDTRYKTLGFDAPFIERVYVDGIDIAEPTQGDATSSVMGRINFVVRAPNDRSAVTPTILAGYDTQVKLGLTEKGYIFSGDNIPVPPVTGAEISVNEIFYADAQAGDELDIPVVNSDGDEVGEVSAGVNVVVGNSTVNVINSEGDPLATIEVVAEGVENYEAPDGTVNITNTVATPIATVNVASGATEPYVIPNVGWTQSDGTPQSTPYGEPIVCDLPIVSEVIVKIYSDPAFENEIFTAPYGTLVFIQATANFAAVGFELQRPVGLEAVVDTDLEQYDHYSPQGSNSWGYVECLNVGSQSFGVVAWGIYYEPKVYGWADFEVSGVIPPVEQPSVSLATSDSSPTFLRDITLTATASGMTATGYILQWPDANGNIHETAEQLSNIFVVPARNIGASEYSVIATDGASYVVGSVIITTTVDIQLVNGKAAFDMTFKLVAAYVGAAIRVKLVATSVEHDIPFTNGRLDVANLRSVVGVLGFRVVRVYNQLSNGDIYQSTGSLQPILQLIGDEIFIHSFDGVDSRRTQCALTSGYAAGETSTDYVVQKMTKESSGNQRLVSGVPINTRIQAIGAFGVNVVTLSNGSVNYSSAAVNVIEKHLMVSQLKTGSTQMWINGNLEISVAAGTYGAITGYEYYHQNQALITRDAFMWCHVSDNGDRSVDLENILIELHGI